MQTDSSNNIWRTIVIVACCMIACVFGWQFLTHASSDLQAFFVGIFVFGVPAGIPVGMLLRPRPKYTDADAQGHQDGLNAGYRAAIAEESVIEVIIPIQQHSAAAVRR